MNEIETSAELVVYPRSPRTWPVVKWSGAAVVFAGAAGHWLSNRGAWWVWLIPAAVVVLLVAGAVARRRPTSNVQRPDVWTSNLPSCFRRSRA